MPLAQAIDQTALRERLVAAYAAGALEPALQILVEAQGAILPESHRDRLLAEYAAGAMFESEEPVAMSADALDQVFTRIDSGETNSSRAMKAVRAARAATQLIDEVLALPSPVRDHALEAIGEGGWTFAGPGIRVLPLPCAGPSKLELLRIEPGWGAPRHTHKGGEYTLVLAGAFHDNRGIYRAGDIAVAGPGIVHRPTAEQGEICYSLAVTDAPLEFTGALGFIQKLWRH
jgi:putative transcriptional regulator